MDLWLKDLKANSNPDIKIFLIGNKSDLEDERVVSREEAEKYKNDYELDLFLEASAKNGINSTELFTEAAKLLFSDYSEYKITRNKQKGEILKIEDTDNNDNNKQKKKGCC